MWLTPGPDASMTRLFISLYLFVAISLVTLTAGLEQIFFADAPPLNEAQKAWLTLLESARQSPSDLKQLLQNADISHSTISADSLAASQTLQERITSNRLIYGYYEDRWQVFIPLPDTTLIVASFDENHMPASNWWLYSSVFFVLLGIVIALWMYPLWRDLSKLVDATTKLEPDGSIPLPSLSSRSPLAGIVHALTVLSANVKTLLQNQRELAGAVTHEFKTPLARLKFALADDEGLTATQLSDMRKDIDELDTLVQEMLDFTRFHASKPELHMEHIPLAELCNQRLSLLKPMTSHTLWVRGDEPILVADGHLLSRALDNVLNNAARHARSTVEVTIEERAEAICIFVDDDGDGIDDRHKETVFDAFFRADSDRARQTGGAGLGLATVKRIMQWHQGRCFAENSPLGGAKIVLLFQKAVHITPQ